MRAGTANTADPSKVLLILAFAAIYLLWGSTYLAIRYTVDTLPPVLMAGIRAFVAGLILFGFFGVPRVRLLRVEDWRTAAITGGLFFVGCHGLLFWMERRTPSGIAALSLATIPGWMAVLSHVAGGSALRRRTLVGLLLGLAGVALLVLPPRHDTRSTCSPTTACVLLVSAMSWASGSLYARSAPLPEHTGTATAMQLLCGGALAILVALLIGEAGEVDSATISMRSLLSLLYLIVFGSLVSFTAYIWLLRVAEPATVGTYAYVNPVVALVLGWLFGGEPMGSQLAAAAALIVLGVVLIHHDQNWAQRWRTGRLAGRRQNDTAAGLNINSVVAQRTDAADCSCGTLRETPPATQGKTGQLSAQQAASPCTSQASSTPDAHERSGIHAQ